MENVIVHSNDEMQIFNYLHNDVANKDTDEVVAMLSDTLQTAPDNFIETLLNKLFERGILQQYIEAVKDTVEELNENS